MFKNKNFIFVSKFVGALFYKNECALVVAISNSNKLLMD